VTTPPDASALPFLADGLDLIGDSHGTTWGYDLHRRLGIPQCEDCKRAHAKRIAGQRARRRIAAGRTTTRLRGGGEWEGGYLPSRGTSRGVTG
jgi:hypothetical protein